MSVKKYEAILEIQVDDEELAKTIIEAISPDDEPEGGKVKTKAYKEGKNILINITVERGDVLTVKNTVEEYLRSIATVINALDASKNEKKLQSSGSAGGI
ncbi:MAG: KEOPS complex subunit Pcc1 [Fervidicoccaceae archaeon]